MIPIVFSTDHNYIMQTGVCILSLLQSADNILYDINIIINEDVTNNDKELLYKQVSLYEGHKVTFITTNGEFSDSYEVRGISTAAYYRLLIPWLLPQYDKVIYSDVDVIFKISLEDVFNINLGDKYFGAIKGAYFRYSKEAATYVESIGLKPDNYYNSGFLLINSKKLRDDNLRNEIMKYASLKLTYQDQDIINLLCKGMILEISPRYCITPAFYEQYFVKNPDIYNFYGNKCTVRDILEGKNCILHYAGAKPWNTFVYGFIDWWTTYRVSIFFDSDYNLNKFYRILHPRLTFKQILNQIKLYIRSKI